MKSLPGIIIAGTNSGCGKTTIAAGIMAALVKRGLKVQPYKVGPDYIDPMFHTFIAQNHSRNLDSWMLDEDTVRHLFIKHSYTKDIAVVEGVMGMYDGFGGYSVEGSTAHVSKIIKAPVVLVVNAEGASLSIAALVKGFKDFDRDVDIKGVILNNIKTEAHFQLLKQIIEENTGILVVGYLAKSESYSLSSRHLGLVPCGEVQDVKKKINILAEAIVKTIDLELLINIANTNGILRDKHFETDTKAGEDMIHPRIAVAYDKAFNFYYRDNLDLLEMMGAELITFSPLENSLLPKDIDGLYIGGGYPEMWARQLEQNESMRESIKKAVHAGIPGYAECGGLMYMTDTIADRDGNSFQMTGLIPGKSEMTTSLKRFGYVEITMLEEQVLSSKGLVVRAHEFHYSQTTVKDGVSVCCQVSKSKRNKEALTWKCGYKINNLLAGYPHIHFWANTQVAGGFMQSCRKYRMRKDGI